ncbi:hypothetical protein ACFWY6_30330 [Streptomyces sp. NPDC059037]
MAFTVRSVVLLSVIGVGGPQRRPMPKSGTADTRPSRGSAVGGDQH